VRNSKPKWLKKIDKNTMSDDLGQVMTLADFLKKPGTGICPTAFNCGWRRTQDFSCLADREACEVSKFDHIGP